MAAQVVEELKTVTYATPSYGLEERKRRKKSLLLWFQTLQETRRFQASDLAVHCMTWTREGSTRLLCVASQDARIHIIDAASGLPVRIIAGHSRTPFALCVSAPSVEHGCDFTSIFLIRLSFQKCITTMSCAWRGGGGVLGDKCVLRMFMCVCPILCVFLIYFIFQRI